jgi:hypothetical protein
MAKPKGENQKAVTARERKAEAENARQAESAKNKEDAAWVDPDKLIDRKADRAQEKVG